MKAKVLGLMTMVMGLLYAAPLLAAPAAAGAATGGTDWVPIGAGIGMAIASGPGARPAIFLFLIFGLVFIESLALYTFVIIFIKVK
jgi:F-type H+-transporting ATPase subunit c